MTEGGAPLAWLLPLLRFASPTLPVGAYAYSRGLEYAVHAGWVTDERSASDWIVGLLEHLGGQLDGPLFVRLYAALAAGDREQVERWNAWSLAARESAELRLEDTQLGAALVRLLVAQGPCAIADLDASRLAGRDDVTYGAAFALAMLQHVVPLSAALHAYLWTLTEAQVSAAVRLVPLGQTAGQRILAQVVECLPGQVERALVLEDDAIGAFAPALALGSALHETQYTRLFRS
jgi:urease accessory protein